MGSPANTFQDKFHQNKISKNLVYVRRSHFYW